MTENTPKIAPKDYWLTFCMDWNTLANEAYDTGQTDMGLFFDELADDAGDVWAGLYGPLTN
ncbi:MAG: hypothetical protein LC723_06225 [Actinobacteria bacterium]|nr:hypothetical protein [Actinomycetota bacterium]